VHLHILANEDEETLLIVLTMSPEIDWNEVVAENLANDE
jgi:hypothetical protein